MTADQRTSETPSAAGAAPAPLAEGSWRIVPERSRAGFSVRKMGLYYVKGRFRRIEGRIEAGPGAALRGRVTIDARSITTRMPPRDWHLRTRDFLDVGRHPAIEIEVERVEHAADGELTVPATFEIRGASRPVELAGHMHGQSLHLQGTLDRRDFGVRARAPFEWIVGHEVRLDVALALERA